MTSLHALTSWPGLEATERLQAGKAYREQAVGEVHLLRRMMEMAGPPKSAGLGGPPPGVSAPKSRDQKEGSGAMWISCRTRDAAHWQHVDIMRIGNNNDGRRARRSIEPSTQG